MKKAILALVLATFSTLLLASGTTQIVGKNIKTRDDLHNQLAKDLHFPKYYGKNLDAMFDVLIADVSGPTTIRIKNVPLLKARLGAEYVEAFIQAISEAAEENRHIILLIE
jgi:ribonuclease inhibitor